jgi:RNA polymerase sigma-70 factor, ECF subfamily
MPPSDEELVEKSKRGDTAAFEMLVKRHDARVLSLALSFTKSEDDAKDIYQEVFIRAFRGIRGFEGKSEFTTWLHRITTNVCLTYNTETKSRRSISLDAAEHSRVAETLMDKSPSSFEVSGAAFEEPFHEALEKLSPQQRLMVVMKHHEGYKIKEIAERLGCSEGTVKQQLFRATEKLRTLLNEYL